MTGLLLADALPPSAYTLHTCQSEEWFCFSCGGDAREATCTSDLVMEQKVRLGDKVLIECI